MTFVRIACAVLALALTACADDASDSANDPQLSKADEISRINQAISATMIEGNARKYIGQYVRIRCKISNVVDGSPPMANAQCGKSIDVDVMAGSENMANVDYSDPDSVDRATKNMQRDESTMMKNSEDVGLLVLVGDKVQNLDGNQKMTVIGKVLGPREGRTVFGSNREFPTVRLDYAE